MTTHPIRGEPSLPVVETRVWLWFIGVGAALVLLGAFAAANLLFAAMIATYVPDGMVDPDGLYRLIYALAIGPWGWIAFWIISTLLYLSAAMAALRSASGLVGSINIVRSRRRWRWMLAAGMLSIAATIVIALGWPIEAVWMLGLVLTVDLSLQGAILIVFGFTLRRAS